MCKISLMHNSQLFILCNILGYYGYKKAPEPEWHGSLEKFNCQSFLEEGAGPYSITMFSN